MSLDEHILPELDLHTEEITLATLEQNLKNICTTFSTFGEETLFLRINLKENSSSYFGSSLGNEFISDRIEILEQFYKFCKDHYCRKDGSISTGISSKEGENIINPQENDEESTKSQNTLNNDSVEKETYSEPQALEPVIEKGIEEDSILARPVTRNSSKVSAEKPEIRKSSRRSVSSKVSVNQNKESDESGKKLSESKDVTKQKINVEENNKSKVSVKEEKVDSANENLTPRRTSSRRQIKTPSWVQSYVVDGLSGKKNTGKQDKKPQQPTLKNVKTKNKIGDADNENEHQKLTKKNVKTKIRTNAADDENVVEDDETDREDSEMEIDDSDNDADYIPDKDKDNTPGSEEDDKSDFSEPKGDFSEPEGKGSKVRGKRKVKDNILNISQSVAVGSKRAKGLKCYKCGFVFSVRKNLKRHLKSQHNASLEDNVKPEGDGSSEEETVDSNKDRERKFKCHVCNAAFYWKKNLKAHLKRRHDIVLENERKRVGETDEIRDAQIETTGDGNIVRKRSFKCYQCKKGFFWKRNLTQHLKRKHNLSLRENVRPDDYESDKELNFDLENNGGVQYQKSKGRFKCDRCSYVFHWKNNLRRHLVGKHQIEMAAAKEILAKITLETGRLSRIKSDGDLSYQKAEHVDESLWMKVELENDKEHASKDTVMGSTFGDHTEKSQEREFKFRSMHRKPYICKICNAAFKNKSNLWRHASQHSRTKLRRWKLSCSECDRGFDSDIALKSHLRMEHKKLNVFKCEKCHATMHTIIRYKQHIKTCQASQKDSVAEDVQVQDLTCHICLKVFKKQKKLEAHIEEHNVVTNSACKICGKKFALAQRLQLHMQTHMAEMKLSCVACDKKFSFPCNYSRHLQYVHKDMRPFCKKCAALFDTEGELNEHLKSEHKIAPNMCKHCGITIPDPVEMKTHKLTHKPSLVCEICGETFERKGLLKEHLVLHTDEYPFKCDKCDARFQLNKELAKHQVMVHGVKKCQCDECGRVFKLPQTLKKHLLTHTNVFAYPCKHCPRQFRSTDGLKYHMLLKHKDDVEGHKKKVYKCEHCGKLMGQKHVYDRHTKMHTGEKPYTCQICNTSFPVRARLNQHMKRHSTTKQFSCEICNVDFWERGSLKHHLLTRKHKEAESNATENIIIHNVQPNQMVQINENQEIEIPMLVDGAAKEYHVELVKPEPNEYHVELVKPEASEIQEVQEVTYDTSGIEVGVPYQVIQIPTNDPSAEHEYIYIRIPDMSGENTNIVYDVDTTTAVRSILNSE